MIRLTILAAMAALAAGAAQAETVRVSLVGKSTDQIRLELAAAARKVCLVETQTALTTPGSFTRCYKATLKSAMTTLEGAQLAEAPQFAQR
jgi:hypothetical protein